MKQRNVIIKINDVAQDREGQGILALTLREYSWIMCSIYMVFSREFYAFGNFKTMLLLNIDIKRCNSKEINLCFIKLR